MRPTRIRPLLGLAFAVTVIGAACLHVWQAWGQRWPALPWASVPVLVVLAAAILTAGWPVYRWQQGQRDQSLDPLRAARIAILARAAQPAAAILTGWYLAQAVALLATPDVGSRRLLAIRAGVVSVAAVAVWVAGWVVEGWCRVDEDRPGDPG